MFHERADALGQKAPVPLPSESRYFRTSPPPPFILAPPVPREPPALSRNSNSSAQGRRRSSFVRITDDDERSQDFSRREAASPQPDQQVQSGKGDPLWQLRKLVNFIKAHESQPRDLLPPPARQLPPPCRESHHEIPPHVGRRHPRERKGCGPQRHGRDNGPSGLRRKDRQKSDRRHFNRRGEDFLNQGRSRDHNNNSNRSSRLSWRLMRHLNSPERPQAPAVRHQIQCPIGATPVPSSSSPPPLTPLLPPSPVSSDEADGPPPLPDSEGITTMSLPAPLRPLPPWRASFAVGWTLESLFFGMQFEASPSMSLYLLTFLDLESIAALERTCKSIRKAISSDAFGFWIDAYFKSPEGQAFATQAARQYLKSCLRGVSTVTSGSADEASVAPTKHKEVIRDIAKAPHRRPRRIRFFSRRDLNLSVGRIKASFMFGTRWAKQSGSCLCKTKASSSEFPASTKNDGSHDQCRPLEFECLRSRCVDGFFHFIDFDRPSTLDGCVAVFLRHLMDSRCRGCKALLWQTVLGPLGVSRLSNPRVLSNPRADAAATCALPLRCVTHALSAIPERDDVLSDICKGRLIATVAASRQIADVIATQQKSTSIIIEDEEIWRSSALDALPLRLFRESQTEVSCGSTDKTKDVIVGGCPKKRRATRPHGPPAPPPAVDLEIVPDVPKKRKRVVAAGGAVTHERWKDSLAALGRKWKDMFDAPALGGVFDAVAQRSFSWDAKAA